ncbi:MAG: WG repeat-containing protein [Oscillospiraceae bacterium]
MIFKKIGCAAAAAAVAATVFSLPASAAGERKLLIEPATTVDKEGAIWNIGDSLYASTLGGYIDGFYSVTDKDRAAWQETGDFSYSKVEVDGDISTDGALTTWGSNLAVVNGDTIVKKYAYDFNGTDKLTVTYETENWFYVRDDGYMVEYSDNADELVITVTAPDGEKSEAVLDTAVNPSNETASYWWSLNCGLDDYVCVILYVNEAELASSDIYYGDVYDMTLNLDLIGKDGSVKTAWNGTVQSIGLYGAVGDYVLFTETDNLVKGQSGHIYNTSTDKMSFFNINPLGNLTNSDGTSADSDIWRYYLTGPVGFDEKTGKAVMKYTNDGEYAYQLADLSKGGEAVSGFYKDMSSIDGELYLVQTADDKWGYINSDGELLKTFDDAGNFAGKFAPVVKDGKAFLINKNMQRVSEKIDAEAVSTHDKGLYNVTIDGAQYFMTYTDAEDDSAAETPDDTNIDDTDNSNTNNDDVNNDDANNGEAAETDNTADTDSKTDVPTDKTNPDTGAEKIVVFGAIAAVSVGAITLSKKRRR